MNVFILWHENKNTGDQKLLGVFSSEQNAANAKVFYLEISGFRDSPDGFLMDRYEIDRKQWVEGF